MNDQKEVNLAIRVAIEAAKAHRGCAPETCGGTRSDQCALGYALDDLTAYQHPEREAAPPAKEWIWAPATIADVRHGDVIRPAGSDQASEVIAIGPAMTWHVDDVNGGQSAQFRPGEHPYVRTIRMITIAPLDGGPHLSPPHGMHTDFAIEIRTTEAEWLVIRALGGWANRVAVINHP